MEFLLRNAEKGKQGAVVEETAPTIMGASVGNTVIPTANLTISDQAKKDLAKAFASKLLKSKILKLPCPKCRADPLKDCASKKIKSGFRIHFFTSLISVKIYLNLPIVIMDPSLL